MKTIYKHEKDIYDVYFQGSYVGYAWAMTAEEAIKSVVGSDWDDDPSYTAVLSR